MGIVPCYYIHQLLPIDFETILRSVGVIQNASYVSFAHKMDSFVSLSNYLIAHDSGNILIALGHIYGWLHSLLSHIYISPVFVNLQHFDIFYKLMQWYSTSHTSTNRMLWSSSTHSTRGKDLQGFFPKRGQERTEPNII